jgi:hypothetical protein
MTVTCPGCHTTLNIPDDRLPKGKVVSAACPRCKGAITIDTRVPPPPASQPEAAPEGRPAEVPAEPAEPSSYDELGQPKALVCVGDPTEQRQVFAFLRESGFAPQAATSPAQAMERLRFSVYAVLILREGFDGPAANGPSLMGALAEMPMSARRNLHVVLVSPAVTSLDSTSAFARSVDVVLHPSDLPRLGDALKRSQTESEHAYRIFRESLRDLGRD